MTASRLLASLRMSSLSCSTESICGALFCVDACSESLVRIISFMILNCVKYMVLRKPLPRKGVDETKILDSNNQTDSETRVVRLRM